MPLGDIQGRFKTTMLDTDASLEDVFVSDRIPLDERLKIYRGNIIGSLTDVLRENFSITDNLVGEEFMRGMARHFIVDNLPNEGCLNSYGAGFPAFIAGFELAKALPYLADVAQFEWALQKAYYAQDDAALKAEELVAIAPEALGDLKLELRDSVSLLSSKYPLSAIKTFCEKENRGDEMLDLNQDDVKLMICRPALKTEILELDSASFSMLKHLQDKTLGEAVESVINEYPDFDFQAFLQSQIQLETFLTLNTNS